MKNKISLFRAAMLLTAAVLSCACGARKYASVDASSPYQKPSDCFRIVSYNVGAFGKYIPDMGENIAMVAAMLSEVGADAVTLNELDSLNERHEAFELQALADSLGGREYYFSRSTPYRGGAYGNGVILGHLQISVFDMM
jgi:endonuclease/exonuclease/phosphatase family metal-dependent hydrolase